jgi:hypothetical protein
MWISSYPSVPTSSETRTGGSNLPDDMHESSESSVIIRQETQSHANGYSLHAYLLFRGHLDAVLRQCPLFGICRLQGAGNSRTTAMIMRHNFPNQNSIKTLHSGPIDMCHLLCTESRSGTADMSERLHNHQLDESTYY